MLKFVLFVLLLVLAYCSSHYGWLAHIADKNWVASYVHEQGVYATVFLVTIAALFTSLGGPRQVVSFAFGFAFGFWWGSALVVVSSLAGASITYFFAQYFFLSRFRSKMPKHFYRFRRFVKRRPFTKILILRLMPVGSNLATNVFSGSSGVPFRSFLLASALGYLPQIAIFSLAGHGVGSANHYVLYLSIILGLLSFVLTAWVFRDHKRQQFTQSKKASDAL